MLLWCRMSIGSDWPIGSARWVLSNMPVSQPLRILAVDDDDSIRGSMPFIFPGPRYAISTEADGDQALRSLEQKSNAYDIIIVDNRMPEMTGLELVQNIRARGITGKIVVLSAHVSDEARKAFERMEVQLILSKPFNVEQLRLAVERLAA